MTSAVKVKASELVNAKLAVQENDIEQIKKQIESIQLTLTKLQEQLDAGKKRLVVLKKVMMAIPAKYQKNHLLLTIYLC